MFTRANSNGGGGGKVFMSSFSDMGISVPGRNSSVLIPTSVIGFVPSKVVFATLGEVGAITAYKDGVIDYNYIEYRGSISSGAQNITVDSTGVTVSATSISQTSGYLMCAE